MLRPRLIEQGIAVVSAGDYHKLKVLASELDRYRECLEFVLAEANFENAAETARIHNAIHRTLKG